MKRLISLILCLFTVTVFVTGCSNNNKQNPNLETCYNCGEQYIINSNFCPMCGANLESHRIDNTGDTNSNVSIDYSDYGFINNYGMLEWIEIIDYNFEDPQNSYIETISPHVISFQNNYMQLHSFETHAGHIVNYKGDYSDGDLFGEPSSYSIVDNKTMKLDGSNGFLYSAKLLEIQEVEIISGIPIIHTLEDRFEMVIPTYFIDNDREPVITDYETNNGIVVRYYLEVK